MYLKVGAARQVSKLAARETLVTIKIKAGAHTCMGACLHQMIRI